MIRLVMSMIITDGTEDTQSHCDTKFHQQTAAKIICNIQILLCPLVYLGTYVSGNRLEYCHQASHPGTQIDG